jgi:hypothetical protein
MSGGEVRFSGKTTALIGVLGGVAVAVGVPVVVLIYGQNMGWGAQLTVIILALVLGTPIAAIPAILAVVIPASASGGHGPKIKMEKNKDGTKKIHLETSDSATETTAPSSDNETG